jgi:hypothetical protein
MTDYLERLAACGPGEPSEFNERLLSTFDEPVLYEVA